jgi:acyl carrier protein
MDERSRVREFVGTLLQRKGDTVEFGDADALVTAGRLDSVEIIELVAFMEEAFGIDFARVDFDREDFESVSTMVALVKRSSGPT